MIYAPVPVPVGASVEQRFVVLDAVLELAFELRASGEGVGLGVMPSGYVFACPDRPLVAA